MNKTELDKALIDFAMDNRLDGVKNCLSLGANINAENENGVTSLMYAALRDHGDVVKHLLECGADIDRIDNLGQTALSKACHGYSTPGEAIIRALVEQGANINHQDKLGSTPILTVLNSTGCDIYVLDYLLKHGADIFIEDQNGYDVLGFLNSITFYDNTEISDFLRSYHEKKLLEESVIVENNNQETIISF